GVGRAAAHSFARRGALVGLVARGLPGLEDARREVDALGGRGLVLQADVAEHDQVEAAAAAVETELGPIDIWVNDAMATVFAPFLSVQPEEFQRATAVTYLGAVYGTMAALRRMVPRNRGKVVQVGSALAYRAIPLQSAYCGAKFAVRGFTDSVRTELLHMGVDVNLVMVQMPALNTPQFDWARNKMSRKPQPVPPIFQPEIAAEAIVYAAHSRRREVWVGSSSVEAILGNKVFPGLLDRYLARKGYAGQLADEPADPSQPDNLFDPVPGDPGTHGRFDNRATRSSLQLWATDYRGTLIAAALGFAGFIGAMIAGGRPLAREVGSGDRKLT